VDLPDDNEAYWVSGKEEETGDIRSMKEMRNWKD
jgi:hypothetical protein